MKNLPYLLLLIIFTGCTHSSKKENDLTKTTATTVKDTILPGDKDSILIDDDNYKLTRGELRKILKENSELSETEFPRSPDITYWGKIGKNLNDFGSESGQDNYYVLYAYFLKAKNGESKYRQRRETLVKIYRDINSIYGRLSGGGTYFGHQYSRILGYAEYSISLDNDGDYNREYDISRQKALYINALKQHITDEIAANNNNGLTPKQKRELTNTTFKAVKEIDNLITNYFYLNMAREFQYSNY